MLVEIARFWVSLAEYDDAHGRYVIRGVIGPDEFHSGYPGAPYDGVDNNAYTNVMAVWTILRALDALAAMPEHVRDELRERLALGEAELERWRAVTTKMYVPFHDGVISQFEGYEALAELDWERYRERYPNIQRMDRILEAEGDDVNALQGVQAGRRPDAVLSALRRRTAGGVRAIWATRCTNAQIADTTDYYLARTSHGSTLSAVVHAWVLARREPGAGDGLLRHRARRRHGRHPGRNHTRGHSPRRHGRQRRPRPALLLRPRDPREPPDPRGRVGRSRWARSPSGSPTAATGWRSPSAGGERGSRPTQPTSSPSKSVAARSCTT